MDIGAALADDQTCYFHNWSAGEVVFLGKNYSTMKRPIKAQDSFKIEQKVGLPTKVWSLRLRNYSTMGPQYVFLTPADKNRPLNVQSDRRINWSSGFLS